MLRLFHVSEESSIRRFHPRPSPAGSSLSENVVWAVDEPHLPNYLRPRDCPRVTYRLSPATSAEDLARFFAAQTSHVVAIGSDWLARAANQIPVRLRIACSFLPVARRERRILDLTCRYTKMNNPLRP